MNWKRYFAGVMAAAMVLSMTSLAVSSDTEEADTSTQTDEVETTPVDEDFVYRTEKEVLENSMIVAAENDNLIFYIWDFENETEENPAEDIYALENKKTGYVWWSSPVNAAGDENATPVLRKELASALVLTYGEPSGRSTSNVRSGDTSKCGFEFDLIDNGVEVTYNFRKAGIKVPVQYVLCEDYLSVSVDVAGITEKDSSDEGKITTALTLLNAFGAGDDEAEGYFVVPDGSGAIINFNNGKTTAKSYAQRVYGSDVTAVPNTKGAVTEQVYLPMYGIVRDDNALMVMIEDGDGNAVLNANVSGQSKSSYNLCNFQFILRNTDTYYMGGEANALTVFESGSIKTEKIAMRYYPVADETGTTDYTDVAACYRDYLVGDGGVSVSTEENSAKLYLDIYGGAEKPTNILGIPVTLKTSMTSFAQTEDIVSSLKSMGVNDMVVSLNNWTNAGIAGKVDYKANAAGVLGGNGDFEDLLSYFDSNSISYYPVVDNKTFKSGQGYYSFSDSTIRVSGSYSRVVSYERAFGTPDDFKDTLSLLSPSTFTEIYDKLTENYKDAGLHTVSIGTMTTSLYGDYGKQGVSREASMNYITECLSGLQTNVGSVLAQSANAYALPYVSHVTNIPLCSSGFDLFDEDIPFYQLVLHGVIPYTTTAINGSADSERLLLQAIATGSNLHYDMLYEETSALKDTDLDVYFYANYAYWVDAAAQEYALAKTILSQVSGSTIVDYTTDGDVITTVYDNGTETTVNMATGEITLDGLSYSITDFVEEGDLIF